MVESGNSSLALIIFLRRMAFFEIVDWTGHRRVKDIRRATEDEKPRSCPSPHPIGGANSQLQFWQSFPPSFGVLGRNYCSPANFARRETACFDLATNRRQSNSIPTRELIERIGSLHVALLPGS
jgi:hypothetical protein